MVKKLTPNLSTLPDSQLRLWADLVQTPDDFVLVGGTAVALQLGHRASIDFDFFSSKSFDPDVLLREVPYLDKARIIRMQENTLTCTVEREQKVQVSFFGDLDLNRVHDPLQTADNKIKVASLEDMAGMKAAVITKRATWKDYVDMAAILQTGITIETALGVGKAIYGGRFEPMLAIKALGYHADIRVDTLAPKEKKLFNDAVKQISVAVAQIDLNKIPKLSSKKNLCPSRKLSR